MTEVRRNENVRAAQGMTKAERKRLKKNGSSVGKDGGETKQTLFSFQLKFALAHGHVRFFQLL
jgi:hypothetical protein